MTIRDSAGREFETKLKNWKDGRKWMIGGWRNLCKWNLVEKDDKFNFHDSNRRKNTTGYKVRDPLDQYGADIFKSGRATQPKNPYFVARIRAKKRDQLYIPIDVVRDYKLELPSSMTIRDSAGREFEARLKNWKDGRIWLSGGWRSLCRWNLVEKDDRSICEFVRGKGKKDLYLKVQVLHEGSVSNPNKKYKK
ncbi:unnamed protein product [Withania somnifera]